MQGTTQSRRCAVCESVDKRVVFDQPLVLPEGRCSYTGYQIVVCNKCGFVFADTILSQGALDEHYAGPTKVAQELNQEGEPARDLVRIDGTLKAVMPLVHKNSRIFDVGCGTARLLGLLKQHGYEHVMGLDQSPDAAAIARAKYNVPVTVGSIFDYTGQDLDLVMTCHVLEHIADAPAFLQCLYGLIGVAGILFVEVPNASDAARFADPDAVTDSIYIRDLYTHFTPEHVNFFSTTSLRNLMTRFGFQEVFCNADPSGVISSAWKRRPLEVDPRTASELTQYAQASRELQEGALQVIGEIAASGREILVWGAGLHTQRLLASSALGGANITAFIDSDPGYRGGQLAGKPIVGPAEIASFGGEPAILISSWKAQSPIHRALNALQLPNEPILLYASV